jgi:hypothetical protein
MFQDTPLALDLERRTDQHDWDFGADYLVSPDDLEIDMRNGVPHRVALELASQDQMVGAVHFQGDNLVEPMDRKGRTQVSGDN